VVLPVKDTTKLDAAPVIPKTPETKMGVQSTAFDDFLAKTITDNARKGNATRLETVILSLSVRGVPLVAQYACQKMHTDTSGIRVPSFTCQIAEKARTAQIISPTKPEFSPLNPITRSEAYAVLMRSICIVPDAQYTNWQE